MILHREALFEIAERNLSYVLVGGKPVHLPVQVDELEPGKDPGGLVRAGVLEVAVGQAVGLARRRHAGEQRHEGVQRGLGGLSAVIVAAAKYCFFLKKMYLAGKQGDCFKVIF